MADVVPLREHMELALRESDRRIDQRLDAMERLGDMQREYILAEFKAIQERREADSQRHQEWRESVNARLDTMESAARTRAAYLATGLVVLGLALGIIQFLRGPF